MEEHGEQEEERETERASKTTSNWLTVGFVAEGVLVARKDFNLPKHNEIDTRNLYVRQFAQIVLFLFVTRLPIFSSPRSSLFSRSCRIGKALGRVQQKFRRIKISSVKKGPRIARTGLSTAIALFWDLGKQFPCESQSGSYPKNTHKYTSPPSMDSHTSCNLGGGESFLV